MPDVVHCSLDELGAVLAADADRHVEEVRQQLTEGLTFVQEEMVRRAPRDKGAFAASLEPYVGEPGSSWSRGDTQAAGAGDVERIMERWRPGQEVGVATDAPYGKKLILHAGRYTKKAPAGWVESIVQQANARLEEG